MNLNIAKGKIETLKSIMEDSQSELDELTRGKRMYYLWDL